MCGSSPRSPFDVATTATPAGTSRRLRDIHRQRTDSRFVAELDDVHLGTVSLHPSGPVVAGAVGRWQLIYTVGTYGIDEGGTIKVAQRFASDWQVPQFEHPERPGYTTAVTTGQASLALRYDPKGHERPWMKTLILDVFDGSLAPGDRVTITMGDTSGGSPGIRAQSFQESRHEFRVLVDPTNACLVRRVSSSPGFPILPGGPVRIVCVIPSDAIVGQATEIFLRGEDVWGNPTDPPPGIELEWHGSATAKLERSELIPTSIGEGRVVAQWNGESFRSNPAIVSATRPDGVGIGAIYTLSPTRRWVPATKSSTSHSEETVPAWTSRPIRATTSR